MEEVKEQETTDIIRLGKPFTFFADATYKGEELFDSGVVEGIGILKGRATTKRTKLVFGRKKWAITFQIEAKTPRSQRRPILEGERSENLAMFAELPNEEVLGSFGRIQDRRGVRSVFFDRWHKVDTMDKHSLVKRSEKTKGSPLTVDGADIQYIDFEFK